MIETIQRAGIWTAVLFILICGVITSVLADILDLVVTFLEWIEDVLENSIETLQGKLL